MISSIHKNPGVLLLPTVPLRYKINSNLQRLYRVKCHELIRVNYLHFENSNTWYLHVTIGLFVMPLFSVIELSTPFIFHDQCNKEFIKITRKPDKTNWVHPLYSVGKRYYCKATVIVLPTYMKTEQLLISIKNLI